MAKTESKNLEALEAAHYQAKDHLAALEAELASIVQRIEELPWDMESVEASTETAVALDSRRRIALPRAIQAAKLAELDARDAVLVAREEELEKRRQPAVEKLQEAEKALAEAREAYRRARGEHDNLIYNEMSDVRGERRQVLRERASVESEPVQPRGKPVFTVWQENHRPPSDDPGLSGDAPAHAFGAANVTDKPLSEGSYKVHHEGERTVAVVPQNALREHSKKRAK